jgi:hypothetical protein
MIELPASIIIGVLITVDSLTCSTPNNPKLQVEVWPPTVAARTALLPKLLVASAWLNAKPHTRSYRYTACSHAAARAGRASQDEAGAALSQPNREPHSQPLSVRAMRTIHRALGLSFVSCAYLLLGNAETMKISDHEFFLESFWVLKMCKLWSLGTLMPKGLDDAPPQPGVPKSWRPARLKQMKRRSDDLLAGVAHTRIRRSLT